MVLERARQLEQPTAAAPADPVADVVAEDGRHRGDRDDYLDGQVSLAREDASRDQGGLPGHRDAHGLDAHEQRERRVAQVAGHAEEERWDQDERRDVPIVAVRSVSPSRGLATGVTSLLPNSGVGYASLPCRGDERAADGDRPSGWLIPDAERSRPCTRPATPVWPGSCS